MHPLSMCQPLLEDECQIDILVEMVGWVNRTSYPQAIQHGLGDVSFNAVRRLTSILHTSMLSKSAPSADMEQSTLRSRMRLSSIATSSPLTVAKFPEISYIYMGCSNSRFCIELCIRNSRSTNSCTFLVTMFDSSYEM